MKIAIIVGLLGSFCNTPLRLRAGFVCAKGLRNFAIPLIGITLEG